MKKFLKKLGINTLNDLVGTIGGFLVLVYFIEVLVFIWIDSFYNMFLFKCMGTTLMGIGICYAFDNKTKL